MVIASNFEEGHQVDSAASVSHQIGVEEVPRHAWVVWVGSRLIHLAERTGCLAVLVWRADMDLAGRRSSDASGRPLVRMLPARSKQGRQRESESEQPLVKRYSAVVDNHHLCQGQAFEECLQLKIAVS